MNVSIDPTHRWLATLQPDSRPNPFGEPAQNATVLSVHHTSQGLVRYRRWFNDLLTVELLVPPDPLTPATAATWQTCAVVGTPTHVS